MFKEIREIIFEILGRVVASRLFALGTIFTVLFVILIMQLFQLQIIHGDEYLEEYQSRTLRRVSMSGTRGNIYDCDGNLLAYNELQYNIVISDIDAYNTTNEGINDRNTMLMKLAGIIEKYQYPIRTQYKIRISEEGEMYFTCNSEDERRRFIANVRGRNMSDLSEKDFEMNPLETFNFSKSRYRFDDVRDSKGNAIVIPDKTVLDMINILYTMRLTAYQRYQTTTVVTNVSKECMAEILESRGELKGVDIEGVSVRKYNYAPYLSHIVGYTGQVREEQLKDLKNTDEDYELNDIVGVWGLEKSEERILKGKKGYREMYLNSVGSILEILSETEPQSGKDIYTTISANDQIAIYHLLEQELAGVLVSKIVESYEIDQQSAEQSQIVIPLKDAYFQLINNNVIDRQRLFLPNAGTAEKQIAEIFLSNKEIKLQETEEELLNPSTDRLIDLPMDMQAYIVYIYDYLTGKNSGIIDTGNAAYRQSQAYAAWRNDTISLRDFIMMGIEESWLDTSKLNLSEEYSDTGRIFNLFVEKIMEFLRDDPGFDKVLYKYAIADRRLPGYLLLMALFEQGCLEYDQDSYLQLSTGDSHFAYLFFIDKIRKLQITPAQLALDPCNGSVVVTDIATGKVKALVTYPGFDNNRISESEYLRQCNEDLSLPLLNCATQTQLAPGSTFKPITSVAALEEGAVDLYTEINCTGKYEEVTPNIRCWIWPYSHGKENIIDGIMNSCNYFFADVGHRLATRGDGEYDPEKGMELIRKYAGLFGLDHKSGIEIDEAEPRISDYDPERSAMGQGNHAYNNAQLARYITAVANNGTLFRLSIIDRITEPDGSVLEIVEPEIEDTLSIREETWMAVRTGLRRMITEGVGRSIFAGQDIEVAGKTGTAQEREDRGNHSVFVSYAPYQNPEISVTVNIPYGYSSGNAATLANSVYNYCFGKITLDEILKLDASYVSAVNVSD